MLPFVLNVLHSEDKPSPYLQLICPSALTAAFTLVCARSALSLGAHLERPCHRGRGPLFQSNLSVQVSTKWTANTDDSLDHHINGLPHSLSSISTSQDNKLIMWNTQDYYII